MVRFSPLVQDISWEAVISLAINQVKDCLLQYFTSEDSMLRKSRHEKWSGLWKILLMKKGALIWIEVVPQFTILVRKGAAFLIT